MNFTLIKQNFERGLWSTEMLIKLVEKGVLTAAQFEEITVKDDATGE